MEPGYVRSDGGLYKFSKAYKDQNPRRRRWSDPSLLDNIRQMARRGRVRLPKHAQKVSFQGKAKSIVDKSSIEVGGARTVACKNCQARNLVVPLLSVTELPRMLEGICSVCPTCLASGSMCRDSNCSFCS